MERFIEQLERFFDRAGERLARLSLDWKEHTNRRTILTSVFAGVLFTTLYIGVLDPPANFPINVLINVPQGASLSETTHTFKERGVVRSGSALKIVMTITGHQGDVHAGDYLFKEAKSLFA